MIRLTEARRGSFLVFDNDRYVGRSLIQLGEFSEDQAELFDRLLKPESVVVEVGANIGAHTVVLAKRAAEVHAFEAQRRVFNVLCGNMALNELDNVTCYRVAGGEVHGVAEIPSLDFSAQENNFGSFSMESVGQVVDTVPVAPILIPCHFLKVDVEGWELQILRGAAPMILKHRPIMYVENDRAAKSDELIKLVQVLGYKAYWHYTPLFRPDNFRGVAEDPFSGACSLDMLCLPKDFTFTGLEEATVGAGHPLLK